MNNYELTVDEKFRLFQGKSTRQVDGITGAKAKQRSWYWEPLDYDGDTLWSDGSATKEAEEEKALDATRAN